MNEPFFITRIRNATPSFLADASAGFNGFDEVEPGVFIFQSKTENANENVVASEFRRAVANHFRPADSEMAGVIWLSPLMLSKDQSSWAPQELQDLMHRIGSSRVSVL